MSHPTNHQKFLTSEQSDANLSEHLLRMIYDKVSDLDSDRIVRTALVNDRLMVHYNTPAGYNKVKYFKIEVI